MSDTLPNPDQTHEFQLAFLQHQLPSHQVFRSPEYKPKPEDIPFWQNMVDVRDHIKQTFKEKFANSQELINWFSRLHKIAVLGKNGDRHYSGVSEMVTDPGQLRTTLVKSGVPQNVLNEFILWSTVTDKPYELHQKNPLSLYPTQLLRVDEATFFPYFPGVGRDYIAYPNPSRIPKYFELIWHKLSQLREPKSNNLQNISHIIQYWATAHPFPGVNHSLLMNFSNFLLEEHKLPTVPATVSLWPLAVLLQDRFPVYFAAYHEQYGIMDKKPRWNNDASFDVKPYASFLKVQVPKDLKQQ